jgi:hypothetical protein
MGNLFDHKGWIRWLKGYAGDLRRCVLTTIEHPFQATKQRFGHRKVRYRGLVKNQAMGGFLHLAVMLRNASQTSLVVASSFGKWLLLRALAHAAVEACDALVV